jgi:hypothetical protein
MAIDVTTAQTWAGPVPALVARGATHLEMFRQFLPDASLGAQPFNVGAAAEWAAAGYPISVGNQLELELHNRLLAIGQRWNGGATVDTACERDVPEAKRGRCTRVFPPTAAGWKNWASAILQAMAERLEEAGYGGNALPNDRVAGILTMVSHRLLATDYLTSLGRPGGGNVALADAGFLPGATVAVTTPRDPATGEATVVNVPVGTGLKPGDRVVLPPPTQVNVPDAIPAGGATAAVTGGALADDAAAGSVPTTPGIGLGALPWWVWILGGVAVVAVMKRKG